MADRERAKNNDVSVTGIILRVVLTAVVVGIAAFFTPGFSINGLWSLLIASIVIAGLDYLVERFAGVDASPFGRGITGFIVAAVILYVTRFIVPGFNISVLGAIIGALAVGIIDMIIPGKAL
ncbi:phage holin family protein [Brassicibacter mesophilus]|jgi:putative membrane protein|uniref:phage holin family protein n=1 Tax=Brassicibacter mesophilus TaxID=745119 RepID=UPI003D2153B5